MNILLNFDEALITRTVGHLTLQGAQWTILAQLGTYNYSPLLLFPAEQSSFCF